MYISPRKKKLYSTLIVVLAIAIPFSVVAFFLYRDLRSRAVASPTPKDVRISDLTETSVVISWVTSDTEAEGWVKYSTSSQLSSDSQIAQDTRDENSGQTTKRKTHYVTISNLNPSSSYYFTVGSGTKEYKDPDSNPFNFETAASGSFTAPPTPNPIYGSVTNGSGQSAIVYITLGGQGNRSFPVSALTNDVGNFSIDLSHVRNSSLSGAYDYDDDTQMNIFAQGADVGGAIVETNVGVTSDIEMTMDKNVSTTQIFSDSSQIDIDDDDDDTSDTTDDTDTDYVPVNTNDIILTPMGTPVLVDSTSEIDGVQITNVTENTFSVIWESYSKEQGYVSYGTSASSLSSQAIDDRDSLSSKGTYYMHHITLEDLEPETTYYFKIISGGITNDDGGTAYSQTTPATESTPPSSFAVTGVVTGTAKADAVIIGTISSSSSESADLSVSSDAEGDWVLDLGSVRTSNYDSYFDYEVSDTLKIVGLAAGDNDIKTYIISDTEGQILGVELNINKSSIISELPETAINGIAAVAMTISIMLIIYGLFVLGNYYNEEKRGRWEKEFLRSIE